ncbi:hypothetical protein FQP81_18315 [Pseudoalteromonas distincta]|uniref:helix-turn-helix domain-containing protein n=1 Tax=Pseudoalteromonas TaxID=53246 RepID=UPI000C31E8CA|nr:MULTISPECIES: helix-turn-helix domain-containing protein [Pseudoalteromonas]PKG68627.1 hypothetical protein CXF64_20100 [Pseudoalteromonas sp. GutCa3]TVU70411.1 hypothetical protein FQP81_18315 [Pseudoalteromonas elyakovii]
MVIKNIFQSAYNRRLILAYLICERGPIGAIDLKNTLGWPKNTVKSNIVGLSDLGVLIEFTGSKKTGGYRLLDWGPIKKSWVKSNYQEIIDSLDCFIKKN